MDIGMLWYDDDKKRTLEEKIARAAEYYRVKYGVSPNRCFVHPTLVDDGKLTIAGGVRLSANRTIIKDHFWLGID